jgi:hypothetical protein
MYLVILRLFIMPPRQISDRPADDIVHRDEPPSKKYKFVGNPAGYATRKLLHAAVLDAQTRGKAKYWRNVNVVEDAAKDTVLLECHFCRKRLSCRNPADSVGKHFLMVEGVQSCRNMQKQQLLVNANHTLDSQLVAAGAVSSGSALYNLIRFLSAFVQCKLFDGCSN